MELRYERPAIRNEDQPESRHYLSHRVRQETTAALDAVTVEATTIHVVMATAYAELLSTHSDRRTNVADEAWVAQHRLW